MQLARLLLAVVVVSGPVAASPLLVPGEYPTIQAALAVASADDTVLIACGTYAEHDLVVPSGVTVRSESGQPSCVTVDAENLGRVFSCSAATESIRIEGLTLTRGRSTRGGAIQTIGAELRIQDCRFLANSAGGGGAGGGGAVHAKDAGLDVQSCTFEGNSTGDNGGAVEFFGGLSFALRVGGSSFIGNRAGDDAGAIWVYGSLAELDACDFVANRAGTGGLGGDGGAVVCYWATQFQMNECAFRDNGVVPHTDPGPGALSVEAASVRVVGTSFYDNFSFDESGTGWVGGAYVRAADSRWERCVFAGNRSTYVAALWQEGNAELVGCAFFGNEPDWEYDGSVVRFEGGGTCRIASCTFTGNLGQLHTVRARMQSLTIENSIFAFEPSANQVQCSPTATMSIVCTNVFGNVGNWTGCLAGWEGVGGNLSADPLFCGPAIGDFHLQWGSPCLPANAGGCGLIGAYGFGGCSSVSVVPESFGRIKAKFRSPDGPATER